MKEIDFLQDLLQRVDFSGPTADRIRDRIIYLQQSGASFDSSKDKYKLFRNFMANELGITKEEIERWTKEAVANEIKNKLGQLNFEGIVHSHIKANSYQVYSAIAAEIGKRAVVKIETKE